MKFILIAAFLQIGYFAKAQIGLVECALQKNILYYNLVMEHKYHQCIDVNGYGIHRSVWECNWKNLFISDCSHMPFEKTIVNLYYPSDSILLYSFKKKGYEIYDTCNNVSTSIPIIKSNQFDDIYLVGMNKDNPQVPKFISGNIFKDKIWKDFADKGFDKTNLLAFLKIKCFNLGINELYYSCTVGNKIIFHSVLKGYSSKFTIIFNKKNPDEITVVYKKIKFTL